VNIKDKMKSLRSAMGDIEKQFGRGAIMWLGGESGGLDEPVSVISTGSVGVDRALGVGGLPRSRVVEIYGPEASGKTTFALQTIAATQRAGGVAAFVDAEHALDARYARNLGIDVGQLLVSQPDSGEQALEIVETLVRSGAVDLVVVDSVAALVPKAELEGEMGDSHVGLQARLMSQAMRKLTGLVSKSRSMIIFINQTRQKIGVSFGSPETTTGGNALKFYASVRLDVRRIGSVKDGDGVTGNRVRVRVVKNKLAPPFRDAEVEILYGRGVSMAGELIDMGLDAGLIGRSGSWYTLGEVRIGQGRERARRWLEARPVLVDRLRSAVLSDAPKSFDLGPAESWGEGEGEGESDEAEVTSAPAAGTDLDTDPDAEVEEAA
jgi:recombination protein RecA